MQRIPKGNITGSFGKHMSVDIIEHAEHSGELLDKETVLVKYPL
ncbi:Uncharacterised protein [Yersinia pekkanenii]|uniref:Uncharacterized protein n=1 Tax=Yersinia pekkanenii TaxID=1288385 RepID=A0ABM9TWA6_9GAMM|nr:Uncharacterised protein [Yersinia pekkanenii]